jgi:hypothetical protein
MCFKAILCESALLQNPVLPKPCTAGAPDGQGASGSLPQHHALPDRGPADRGALSTLHRPSTHTVQVCAGFVGLFGT